MESKQEKKTVLGVTENIEAVLCYVLGWVSGFIFLLLEKENKFVRFHALQSLIVFLLLSGIMIIGIIPFIGWLISLLLWPVSLILWIVLMIKSFQGRLFKLPVIGEFVEKQIFTSAKSGEKC
jgi:uncharacterized membrane protein